MLVHHLFKCRMRVISQARSAQRYVRRIGNRCGKTADRRLHTFPALVRQGSVQAALDGSNPSMYALIQGHAQRWVHLFCLTTPLVPIVLPSQCCL